MRSLKTIVTTFLRLLNQPSSITEVTVSYKGNLGGNKAGCHRKRSTPSPTHAGRVFVETVTTTGRPGERRDEGVRASRERSNERIRYASRHSGQGGVLKETINQRRWKDLSSTVRQSVTRGSRQRRKKMGRLEIEVWL